VLQEVRPDVLVTSNWGSIDWALANIGRSTPHVHMEDGFGSDEGVHQIRRRVWARKLLLRHSVTVVPSLTLYGIARELWGLPERRVIHVANGVDCLRFRAAPNSELLARLGVAKNAPVIGAVAPLRPEKNLRRLIDAFALLRHERVAQLVIVGDGPEREKLQLHAAERGVAQDVVFAGFCPTPDRLLRAFSLVALSSDTEQMPLSVLEAMAAGRAVVATDVGDIRQMLAKENHPFLVERSAEQLARAIVRLLDNPAAAADIGTANARHAAEAFGQERMFEAYGRLFG
jgi:glycosyltransferase involved in cell wall biosynthesis